MNPATASVIGVIAALIVASIPAALEDELHRNGDRLANNLAKILSRELPVSRCSLSGCSI